MSVLQARRYQKKDADLDAVAASGVAAAWTAYTPTVTAGSGTFTTASATGRYLVMGKVTFVYVEVTITTNGTAASYVSASLPTTAVSLAVMAGRENNITGKMLLCLTLSGVFRIYNYDGTYPGVSGGLLTISGTYENT